MQTNWIGESRGAEISFKIVDPKNLSVNNLSRLPEFQALCNKYDIVPTYLLSFETLADNKFVSFLLLEPITDKS